jgi:hypothetical protein
MRPKGWSFVCTNLAPGTTLFGINTRSDVRGQSGAQSGAVPPTGSPRGRLDSMGLTGHSKARRTRFDGMLDQFAGIVVKGHTATEKTVTHYIDDLTQLGAVPCTHARPQQESVDSVTPNKESCQANKNKKQHYNDNMGGSLPCPNEPRA